MAKYWTTDLQFKVMDECVQLFGGYGYIAESGMEQFVRDVRITQIYEGTNVQSPPLITLKLHYKHLIFYKQ